MADDVLARTAEVLGAHHAWSDDGGAFDGCACGNLEPYQLPRVRGLDEYAAHAAHQAQMLADAGLLAGSASVARSTVPRSAQDGDPR